MIVKNEAQLKKMLLQKCKVAVALAEEKIHRIIDRVLEEFYAEYDPVEYRRTYQFLNSLVTTGVKETINGYEAEIYFDLSKINYPDPAQGLSGKWHRKEATDKEIFDNNLTGANPHGWYPVGGTPVWTNAFPIIDANAIDILKQELIAQGIPIKK